MPDCELLSTCPFFNKMTEIYKEQYCKGNYALCGRYLILLKARERNMPEKKRIFTISGDNRGLACPLKPIICPGGDCLQCPMYLDWQKRGEVVLICAWCGKVTDRYINPTVGRAVVSHGICRECRQKHFPKTLVIA